MRIGFFRAVVGVVAVAGFFAAPCLLVGCGSEAVEWEEVRQHREILYKIIRGTKIGYVGVEGDVIAEPKYLYGPEIITSAGGVSVPVASGRKYLLLRVDGKEVTEAKYISIERYMESGRCKFIRRLGKAGYLDANGDEVIPDRFDGGRTFYDGIAAVGIITDPLQRVKRYMVDDGVESETRYIDTNGEYVELTEAEATAYRFNVRMRAKNPCPIGTVALVPVESEDGLWGFADEEGTIVIEPKYVAVAAFCGPLAKAQKTEHGRTWYINAAGEELVMYSPGPIEP